MCSVGAAGLGVRAADAVWVRQGWVQCRCGRAGCACSRCSVGAAGLGVRAISVECRCGRAG